MLVLVVLQVRLSSLLWGAEVAEVVATAGWCVALSLEPALVWMHSPVACAAPVRPDEKMIRMLLKLEERC